MLSLDDTIAAVSTPVGEGGIGIVRMSGPDAKTVLSQVFVPANAHRTGESRPNAGCSLVGLSPYRLRYGYVVEPGTGETVDEVLAVFMPAPRTYTRQDVVEINGHGGIVALRRILALCLRQGARHAEPGEFTARAFLHGRLDLAQAEAVLDVVQARTEKTLESAVGQLAGHLSNKVQLVRAILMDVLAHLEASIDFLDDEIPDRHISHDLDQAGESLARLVAEAEMGIIYRQGVRVAIVGRPNVGKSSLLNRLLRTSRAIVTDVPGTTRDTLEESLNLQGVPIVLVDTAGIASKTRDLVERLGIERSRAALSQADLALFVVDGSTPLTDADRAIADLLGARPAIAVLNKADLLDGDADPTLKALETPSVLVSALTGKGLQDLETMILEAVFSGSVSTAAAPMVTSPRHKEALSRALEHVESARSANAARLPADLVAIDISCAVNALGEITGQSASDDLLETIFGRFCIGK